MGGLVLIIRRFAAHAALCTLGLIALGTAASRAGTTNVTTYHDDNLRTGWDQTETVLTPSNVGGGSFGLLQQVKLDEQVDAQPLFISGETIAGGTHDVVYVATENNTIYAIDANTGKVLVKQNLGTAVPKSALPGQCGNNSDVVGINSTPVIDTSTGTLYAIAYTYDNGTTQTFRLHALDLATLTDKVTPVVVSASGTDSSGKPVTFAPAYERQRPGLLESNGTIYAGFGSFCDVDSQASRGWVLGWQASTLTPLAANALVNKNASSGHDFFLSSVWMAGYGIASDDQNGIVFATSNSDPDGKTYSSTYNIEESVVNQSADLTTQQSYFTPKGGPDGYAALDSEDGDLGSGGVLLLPQQPGAYPNLAVAAGKIGPLYLLNRDSLGGAGRGKKVTLGTYSNPGCWCGQAYYTGSDGIGRVVTSVGYAVGQYKVKTSPRTALVLEGTSPSVNDDQDPGFFTAISSNGTTAGTAVVWAVTRPSSSNPVATGVYLQAFDPGNSLARLYNTEAGTWPYAANADANLVPTVANGQVFVASYKNLSIFGIATAKAQTVAFRPAPDPAPAVRADAPHEVYGVVTATSGTMLTLRTRTGQDLAVDMQAAARAYHVAVPVVGKASLVRGDYAADGVLVAKYVLHAKNAPLLWPADH
jgi:hypothetical protein